MWGWETDESYDIIREKDLSKTLFLKNLNRIFEEIYIWKNNSKIECLWNILYLIDKWNIITELNIIFDNVDYYNIIWKTNLNFDQKIKFTYCIKLPQFSFIKNRIWFSKTGNSLQLANRLTASKLGTDMRTVRATRGCNSLLFEQPKKEVLKLNWSRKEPHSLRNGLREMNHSGRKFGLQSCTHSYIMCAQWVND